MKEGGKVDKSEKVIKGIDICLSRFNCGDACPYKQEDSDDCMKQLKNDVLELLKEKQPKKKGKWIDKQFFVGGCCGATCSVCGGRSAGYSKETIGGNDYFFYPYCQNCGADMRGEQVT